MRFLEALKTGRPMRRKSWWRGQGGERWLVMETEGTWSWRGGDAANPPGRGDYFADDWEIA